MFNIWDCFTPIRGLIHGAEEPRRTTPPRRTVRLQLEHLEKREVLSADVTVGPPTINPEQLYRQILQAEASPTAMQALFLQQSLTAATLVLPTFSGFLNTASNYVTTNIGQQLGQQFMQEGIQQVNLFLLNLEDATLSALKASGVSQDPTFVSDVTAINAFMTDPLNYTPPH